MKDLWKKMRIDQYGPIVTVLLLAAITSSGAHAQNTVHLNVDASTVVGTMPPIWRDHYENSLMYGYGGDPSALAAHASYVTDPAFMPEMGRLQPRYIRVSIGRADNPPDTSYFSSNTSVLRTLPYEFYRGGNNLGDANDLNNYNFSFVDSMITLVQSIGAEPFITMDYMPFNLSSDTVPDYQAAMGLLYNLAYDNSIRNAPPSNNAVYGRVMYHLIKHCYDIYGVTYFEHWNEPDQQWLNPIMVKFFWTGDEYQLYYAYQAIATEVSADADLASHVKLGGCSFAMYSIGNLIPLRFLQLVQANSTKFDFLSFHPYSDTQFKGGYDSAKVALVEGWRNQYVPNAELVNGEWGRIDQNSDTWGSLDYGLNKVEHIIDMLDRNVSMSFEVAPFDQETSEDNYTYLGMYRVGPIVPKPGAYVFYNMNKMNDVLNRLELTTNAGIYGLAGMNDAQDKIVIVFPATGPDGDVVELNVSDLPWGQGAFYVNRSELTDGSYTLGEINNLTSSTMESGGVFADTVACPPINGNGRLIVWELSDSPLSVARMDLHASGISVRPNPAADEIELVFPEPPRKGCSISIMNSLGAQVYAEQVGKLSLVHTIRPELGNGLYFIRVTADGKTSVHKVVIDR